MLEHSYHLIITGGTIDSGYNPPTESFIPLDQSVLPAYLEKHIKLYGHLTHETLCMLDSGDIDHAMRNRLLDAILKSPSERILVSHGTNTMIETALFLEGKTQDKIVVLTGAMIPLKEQIMSDAGFNLGYALASLSHLENGVFIAMHGQCFKPDQVRKNFDLARFEAL